MNGYRLSVIGKVIALALCVGALPFLPCASVHAQANAQDKLLLNAPADTLQVAPPADTLLPVLPKKESLLDDYHKKIGFTYGAQARIQASYLWRGLYSGGPNIQASANVGYGGLYLDMWWNIGFTDMHFKQFQPEVDFSLGFNRWGLNIYALFIHNFNTKFFDFNNYYGKGNRLELNLMYTLSTKIPLTFRWGTRIAASDCYLDEAGNIVRAYSSYAEISYTHYMRDGWSIFGAIGMTPWKGTYNPHGAALQNIELRLRKDWSVSKYCGLMLQGQMAVSPMQEINVINLNLSFGVFLK